MIINEEGKKPVLVEHLSKLKLMKFETNEKQTNPVFRYGRINYPGNKMINLYECSEVYFNLESI